jgi:hypothetical protein
MKPNMNRWLVTLVTIITIIGLINYIPTYIEAKEINNFDNGGGQPEWEVVLGGETGFGSDSTTNFSVPLHKGRIQEASFKISCSPDQYGNTLLNPRLDVGIDGDYEWEFTGKGYGNINNQNKFTTGLDRKIVAIGNSKTTNTTSIYLPKTAVVEDAVMEIEGGDLEFGDIYLAAITESSEVYYIKSKGGRSFGAPEYVTTLGTSTGWPRSYSYGIGIGDFDNDGDNDIVANEGLWSWPSSTGNIYLLEKTGANKSFAPKVKLGTTGNYRNSDFAVGDFNNDRKVDFIVSEMSQNVHFFRNDGGLSFNQSILTSSFSGGTVYGKDAADFNLDGNLDVVMGGTGSGAVYILEGNGDGTFTNEVKVSLHTGSNSRVVVAGDYNNDGNPDIIARDSQTWPLPYKKFQFAAGKGDFSFYESMDINYIDVDGWNLWSIFTADGFDFDFNGYQDLVVYNYSWSGGGSTIIRIYWGDGKGQFNDLKTVRVPGQVTGVATPPGELLGGCDNLKVNIGDVGGTDDFAFTGPFKKLEKIDFKNKLNTLLSSPPSYLRTFTDDYGNELIEIPIRFTADALGNVLLKNMSIRYSYDATIDINPHDTNLVNELNDLIPKSGTGEFKVYLSLASDSPGVAKFSDLRIVFNEAPTTKKIPDLSMNEGFDVFELLNLAQYFDDVEDEPEELSYSVYSQTNRNYILASIYNGYYLHLNSTVAPDWHGETEIIISAEDSEKGITMSNKFRVIINPVNDPPRVGRLIPNIDMRTNEVHKKYDLDDPNEYYFYDVDSSDIYFRSIIYSDTPEKYEDFVEIEIDNDTAVLEVRSFTKYKKQIPLRIYCSDLKSVRTMTISDLNKIGTHQDILVNITQFGLGKKPLFPPVWKDIEDIEITEDDSRMDWINLNDFVTDPDDDITDITFTVDSMTNSAFVNVLILSSKDGTNNSLCIIPEVDFDGEALVVLKAEDDEHNYALEEFRVKILPEPDNPVVEIISPFNNATVSGLVVISGSAYDAEGDLDNVEIKIGDNPWVPVDGLAHWNFNWNSKEFTTTIDTITIKARAIDVENRYSEFDTIILKVNNALFDIDNDEIPDVFDLFPNDPLNWLDSDGDGVGDNSDMFPNDPSQWQDGDADGYGDNPLGDSADAFPLDPTQWEDVDGDGYGDNPTGNDPDYYPRDTNRHEKESEKTEESILSTKNLVWLAVIPFIFINIVIVLRYLKRKKVLLEETEENNDK